MRDIVRLKKEAALMLALRHPSIVRIREVSREKGLDYITMDFVPGQNLGEIVREHGPFDPRRALSIVREVALAVSFMHSKGIVHRDLKPENVRLTPEGQVVLVDFGLAGCEKIELAPIAGSIGTALYQPPEQAEINGRFGPISPASDVYGLGATLYFLLAGRCPYRGSTNGEVREKLLTTSPESPAAINPGVPEPVALLVLRCLRKRQNERFQRPRELAQAIDSVLAAVEAAPPPSASSSQDLTVSSSSEESLVRHLVRRVLRRSS